MIEHLPSKHEALSSNPSTTKNQNQTTNTTNEKTDMSWVWGLILVDDCDSSNWEIEAGGA
jgi:hypothetical protein